MGMEKSEIAEEIEREGPAEEVVFNVIMKVALVQMKCEKQSIREGGKVA